MFCKGGVFKIARKTVMNSITSLEKLALVNKESISLLNDFIVYLRSIKRSEKTLAGYKNDIEIFFIFLLEHRDNKSFIEINKRDIVAYQDWLLHENLNSPARIRRLKSSLSSFSGFIENILDDIYPDYKSIIRKVESPGNVPVREKTILSEEQLKFLLDTLVERGKYQQACATALAAFCGVRKSEIVRFKVNFFKDENIIYGSLYKTPEKIQTKGRDGGDWQHKFVIANKFKPYLDLWLAQRNELGIDSEWLFLTKRNGEWNQAKPDTLNSWAITNSQILGTDFYWHCLKHAFCTYLVKLGLPEDVVVGIIGWKTSSMIKIYDDNPVEDKFAKFFDENGIKEVKKMTLSDLGGGSND